MTASSGAACGQRRGGDSLGVRNHCRESYNEPGSFAELAFHPDLSAHELAEPLADCQAQPCPAELPADCGIGLGERLKEPGHLLRGHADAVVSHTEFHEAFRTPLH